MNRQIRQYQKSDLASVLSAWESASALAHPFLSSSFLAEERDSIQNLYLPNSDTWVLEQDQAVVGFISLIDNEIGGLFVHADFHRTGAGKALMDKAKALHASLEVEVFEMNPIGRAFYEKSGFVLMSELMHEETGQRLLRLRFTAE